MTRFAPAQLLEDAVSAMARYDPEHMEDYLRDLGELPGMAENLSRMITVLARKTESELPAAKQVVELLEEMARTARAVGKAAEEIQPGARRAHRTDLERLENPRTNERLWNAP